MISKRTRIAAAMAALTLSACGGGGQASIGGTITGLGTGLTAVLQNNGTDTLNVSGNGNFTFATQLAAGAAYSVTVLTQPTGQVCQVGNGAGSVNSNANSVTTVAVTCVNTATLTGSVSGLLAGRAVTLFNGTVLLPVAANGTASFPGVLVAGTTYTVTVATQPFGQNCVVTNGTGTVSTAGAVTPFTVTCS